MDVLALGAAVSIMVAIVAFGVAFAAVPASAQIRSRLEGAISGRFASVIQGPGAVDPLRAHKAPGALQALVSGAWLARIERDLRLADSRLHPTDFLAIRGALAALGFAVPFVFLGSYTGAALSLLVSAGAALVGFQLPQVWISRRRAARNQKLEAQLPDALTLLANSLKAGFGLLQGMTMAAEQLEHPIATELALTVHETNVGSSTEEAFLALSGRNENYDLDLVVTAVLVQRSAGGNLAEILQTVTNTMRERVRIKGEIQTLTAQQSLTGVVIALLPVCVGGMFLLISPSYISLLFTETMGQVMLAGGFVLEMIGIMLIKRILAIEV